MSKVYVDPPTNQSRGIRRLLERMGIIQEKQVGIVVPLSYSIGYGKAPDPSFSNMIEFYKSNPWVKGAIDELAESSVGTGFHLSANNQDVLKIGEDWCEEIDLDGMSQPMARELWATGNWIAECEPTKKVPEQIIHLPISTMKRFRVETGGVIQYIHQQQEGQIVNIPYEKVVHFPWNRIDASPWGCGLLEPLLRKGIGYEWIDSAGTKHTDYAPSFQSILEETHDSMRKVLRRYVPRHLYKLIGFDDTSTATHASTIKSVRPEDDLVVGVPNREKMDVDVVRITTDPRSRLDPFIEYFHNGMITALETPALKLFLEAGFTEASARTAVEVVERKIAAFRRFLKRRIEAEILKPRVIMEMGWQAPYTENLYRKANLRVNWAPMEQSEITTDNMIRLAQISAETGVMYISKQELRTFLSKRGIELEPEAPKDIDLKKVIIPSATP